MKPTPRRKWYLTTGRRFHWMVLDPIPQSLPVHFFGSRPQPPTSRHARMFSLALSRTHNAVIQIYITNDCVACEWVLSIRGYINKSCLSRCHIWMSHVCHELYEWVLGAAIYREISMEQNESLHIVVFVIISHAFGVWPTTETSPSRTGSSHLNIAKWMSHVSRELAARKPMEKSLSRAFEE